MFNEKITNDHRVILDCLYEDLGAFSTEWHNVLRYYVAEKEERLCQVLVYTYLFVNVVCVCE